MPTKYIKSCFEWIDEVFDGKGADDYAIQRWARAHNIDIITTIPATLQHIGDDSILNKSRGICRTYYYSQNPVADWDNPIVNKISTEHSFAPKYKKLIRNGGKYNKWQKMD
jgi:hypothetical protein